MAATTDERISFICPSCAAHLQVPMRLAGVTGPCPKCGATIVAPKPVAAAEAPKRSGIEGRGLPAPVHHPEPASGGRKGLASLRRRRQPVAGPVNRILESLTDGRTDDSADEMAPIRLEFLQETGADEYGGEEPATEGGGFDASATPAGAALAVAPRERPALPEIAPEAPPPAVERVTGPGAPSPQAFGTSPVTGEAGPDRSRDVAAAEADPLAARPAKPKTPINLQRPAQTAPEAGPELRRPERPAESESPSGARMIDSLPRWYGPADADDSEAAPPAPSAPAAGSHREAPTPIPGDRESDEPVLPSWSWLKTGLNPETPAADAATESPGSPTGPATVAGRGGASEAPVAATDGDPLPERPAETRSAPPLWQAATGADDDLLVGEEEAFDSAALGRRPLFRYTDSAEPLIDPEADLGELLTSGGAPLEETVPPPAPGPFPKWSALESSPVLKESPAPPVLAGLAAGRDSGVPLTAAGEPGSGTAAEAGAVSPAAAWEPRSREEVSPPVSDPSAGDPARSAASPWLPPAKAGEPALPLPATGESPPPARASAAVEELSKSAPPAGPVGTPAAGPVFQSPRFLTGETNRATPWKPPLPADLAPARTALAPGGAPAAPPQPEGEGDADEAAPPAGEAGSIAADPFSSAPPPLFDLSTFGEGEPPRPGDRVTAPVQRITLPQLSGLEAGTARATVSTVVAEAPPPSAPVAASEAAAEQPEPEPPVLEVSGVAPLPAALPPVLASAPVLPPEPPSAAPVPETRSLFSSRAEAAARSLTSVGAAEQPEPAPPLPDSPPEEAVTALPPLNLSLRTRPKPESSPFEPSPAAEAAAPLVRGTLQWDRLESPRQTESSVADLTAASSKFAERLAGREPASRRDPVEPDASAPVAAPEAAAVAPEVPSAVPEAPAAVDPAPATAPATTPATAPAVATVDDDPLEDEGMARMLGFLTKRPSPEGAATPTLEAPAAPAGKVVDVTVEPSGPVVEARSGLPSVDEVLSRPSPKALNRKDTLVDKVLDWLNASESRRRRVILGASAAGAAVVLLVIGLLVASFLGSDEGGQTGTPAAPSPAPVRPAGASPVQPAPPKGEAGGPEASPLNPLVIADGGGGAAPGKAGPSPTPSGSMPASAGSGAKGTERSAGPGAPPPLPAPPATATAAAAGTPGAMAPAPKGGESPASVGNATGTGAAPGGTPPPAKSGATVLPTVGDLPDPFTAEGGGYSVIGAAGKEGAMATGAPVRPAAGGTDPDATLSRQEASALTVDALTQPKAAPGASAGAPAAAAPAGSEEDRLTEQRAAIDRFLAAKTWEERLPLIYEGDDLRERVKAHYASHPDGPVKAVRAQWFDMDEVPADGSDPFYAFYLSIEGTEGEFPIVVRKRGGKFLVDWELFVECKDRLFTRFRDSQEAGPRSFRLVMQRHSYWGKDREVFKDMDSYNCYKIEAPFPDSETFVFLPKSSPELPKLEEIAGWGMPPVDVVLQLERKAFPHGVKHLVIKSLEKPSWVAP